MPTTASTDDFTANLFMQQMYLVIADVVLIIHTLFVLFVILGLILTIIGGFLRWQWIHNIWFRAIHLTGIIIVVAQAWLGVICPLTTLEMWLRRRGDGNAYEGGFIQHWLQQLLYYELPLSLFALLYTAFAALVVVTWMRFPPHWRKA